MPKKKQPQPEDLNPEGRVGADEPAPTTEEHDPTMAQALREVLAFETAHRRDVGYTDLLRAPFSFSADFAQAVLYELASLVSPDDDEDEGAEATGDGDE